MTQEQAKSTTRTALALQPKPTYNERRNRNLPMLLTRRALIASALICPIEARAQKAEPMLLDLRPGKLRLVESAETDVWTINGGVPGPVLRVKQGEEVSVRLINNLSQPAALHWQGVRLANAMDGAPGLTQAPMAPGERMDIRFIAPDAGTYWYRPSAFPNAAEQKGRGLYGLLIVEGPDDPPVDREFLAIIDDWRLDEQGQIRSPFLDVADVTGPGRIGDLITINSQSIPQVMTAPPGARVRLRILNACSARLISLTFNGLRPLVVGVDGQSCEPFEPARMTLPSGPGSRFDVIFDLPAQAGAQESLTFRDGVLNGDASIEPRKLIAFETTGDALPARDPIRSRQNPALPAVIRLQGAKRLDLTIARRESNDPRKVWAFNGLASHGADAAPLFKAKRGQPVTLGFVNNSKVAHSIHVHGHAFRVLHLLDDGWEPYWRDSVIVPPGGTVRVAFVADNPGKWLIESTILDHAMSGLTGWFEVG